jgi:hypothetical protein
MSSENGGSIQDGVLKKISQHNFGVSNNFSIFILHKFGVHRNLLQKYEFSFLSAHITCKIFE